MGDLPGVGDVGGGGGGVLAGGFIDVAEVDGAVDAGFGGFDAFDGKAEAVADGEVEGEGGGDDGSEAVVETGGEGGRVIVHSAGRMAEAGRKGKRKMKKHQCFYSISRHGSDRGGEGESGGGRPTERPRAKRLVY
jgi:hypothetical protein